ncbi:MAG: hypothetical protein IH598_08975 [Bacteroidales bacterium]|nr:hypothetical protein [Bacteroidales bacterium]
MKNSILFTLLFIPLLINAQQEIPAINTAIVEYVSATIGTQVNRGECWDLAYEALDRNNAKWDGKFKFGRQINPKTEMVLPGDLIQFSNVELKYSEGNLHYTETMGQHTAIVYRIIDQEKKIFEIAHQNTDFSGRKVGLSEFNFGYVSKGKLWFYRPEPLN